MKIESKYDVNDKVWFFNHEKTKYYEGTILEITNWDKYTEFMYIIQHNGKEDIQMPIQESNIFASKQEILNKCFIPEKN